MPSVCLSVICSSLHVYWASVCLSQVWHKDTLRCWNCQMKMFTKTHCEHLHLANTLLACEHITQSHAGCRHKLCVFCSSINCSSANKCSEINKQDVLNFLPNFHFVTDTLKEILLSMTGSPCEALSVLCVLIPSLCVCVCVYRFYYFLHCRYLMNTSNADLASHGI